MTITINPKRVQQALAQARQDAERTNGGWTYLEMIGRCLRYLEDPQAPDYFRQAAQNYQDAFSGSEDYTILANLYRLAFDSEQAHYHYQQSYNQLQGIPDTTKIEIPSHLGNQAICTYMLGQENECVRTVEQLRTQKSRRMPWLNVYIFPYLIHARQVVDPAPALEAFQQAEENIRTRRYTPWSEGNVFSPWDAYDEARRVVRELGGDPDAPQEDT